MIALPPGAEPLLHSELIGRFLETGPGLFAVAALFAIAAGLMDAIWAETPATIARGRRILSWAAVLSIAMLFPTIVALAVWSQRHELSAEDVVVPIVVPMIAAAVAVFGQHESRRVHKQRPRGRRQWGGLWVSVASAAMLLSLAATGRQLMPVIAVTPEEALADAVDRFEPDASAQLHALPEAVLRSGERRRVVLSQLPRRDERSLRHRADVVGQAVNANWSSRQTTRAYELAADLQHPGRSVDGSKWFAVFQSGRFATPAEAYADALPFENERLHAAGTAAVLLAVDAEELVVDGRRLGLVYRATVVSDRTRQSAAIRRAAADAALPNHVLAIAAILSGLTLVAGVGSVLLVRDEVD